MTAKQFLAQYKNAKRQIWSGLDEMAKLRAMAEKCTVEFSESGNLPPEEVGVLVARIVDLETAVARRVKELERRKDDILRAIGQVSDERYRDVLILRYINGMTWERIAAEMGYTRQWVCRLHGYALRKIQKIF